MAFDPTIPPLPTDTQTNTPTPTTDSPKHQSDNITIPDQTAVQAQITSRLLSSDAADVCDVTLHTLDRRAIPACRTLLAIRSPYFNTLFFGVFRESRASQVDVALPSHLLLQVLQFAYSGRSPFVESLSIEKNHQRETLLDDAAQLVDLIAAADYCQLPDLYHWCNDVLRKLSKRFHFIVCSALQAMAKHAPVHPFPCRAPLLDVLAKNIRECFLVPDCVKLPSHSDTRPYQGLYKRRWDSHGVLKLTADCLEGVVNASRDPDIQEYLFQALYYWATRGTMLSCARADNDSSGNNPCKDDVAELGSKVNDLLRVDDRVDVTDSDPVTPADLQHGLISDKERWERALSIAKIIDYRAMRPVFLRDYVRFCGLVEQDVLVDAFCHHATKGQSPIEPLADMPDR